MKLKRDKRYFCLKICWQWRPLEDPFPLCFSLFSFSFPLDKSVSLHVRCTFKPDKDFAKRYRTGIFSLFFIEIFEHISGVTNKKA